MGEIMEVPGWKKKYGNGEVKNYNLSSETYKLYGIVELSGRKTIWNSEFNCSLFISINL